MEELVKEKANDMTQGKECLGKEIVIMEYGPPHEGICQPAARQLDMGQATFNMF